MYEHSNNNVLLGIDVGGSHITAALVNAADHTIIDGTLCRGRVEKNGSKEIILEQWIKIIKESLASVPAARLTGIGFAMPGPFNYEQGICLMKGVNKYDALYNFNVDFFMRKQFLLDDEFPIKFENDASCFGLGESIVADVAAFEKIIAVTLGTGFGTTFLQQQMIIKDGDNVPALGQLYNHPYLDGIAEDYVSTAWLLKRYNNDTDAPLTEVKDIAEIAMASGENKARQVFEEFGQHFAACIIPWIKKFEAGCLVIGGSIAKSAGLFTGPLEAALEKEKIQLKIKISTLMEISAITGAASLVNTAGTQLPADDSRKWRKTSQALLPATAAEVKVVPGEYNMYPFYNIGENEIFSGYESLAKWIANKKTVVIDGYGGNDWDAIKQALDKNFTKKDITVRWIFIADFLKPEAVITKMVTPFLGEPTAVWGTRTKLSLDDFYDVEAINSITKDEQYDINVVIGTGAALCKWDNIIYVDIPKNEIQYRMRAGSITNLGSTQLESPAMMYKRFYFVDWIVYNKHRQAITPQIALIADGQWKSTITWSSASAIKNGLQSMVADVVRARPWFEAGTWGGDWMKEHIPQINQHEVNYAWSFELIAPENGIVLESNKNLLEISFDWLMELQSNAVLGRDAARFGTEFPIRFDFLDTFDGGNLSIQCHPSLEYIQTNFGETITQDETYYMLDCKENAKVYLGFQEDIDPDKFKAALEQSVEDNEAIDIEKYVSSFPAHKHDLFLIPNGTIHSSGIDNMVLEISATPYIFTFKMYDWVRLDLEGNPRPINIDHAFRNLNFERKGDRVPEELISKPTIIHSSDGCRIIDLPTHKDHFYKIDRLEFTTKIEAHTNDQCHVLMLVEGESITVKTKNGRPVKFNYAETFIVPAAAEAYEMINDSGTEAKVVRSFIK